MELKHIMLIISAIFIILTLSVLFHQTILEAVSILLSRILSDTRHKISDKYSKDEIKLSLMSVKQREKSFTYKYHVFLRELVFDMGLTDVTPSGFITFLLFMSSVLNVAALFFTKSILTFIIGIPLLMALLLLFIYVGTRSAHFNRRKMLMDTENSLCTTIGEGVVRSVSLNLNKVPMEVQPILRTFLEEQRMQSTVYAIRQLNKRLGTGFDDFCKKAEILETQHPSGYEKVFQFNIKRNARAMKLISIKKAQTHAKVIDGVLSSLVLVLGLVFIPSVIQGMWEFYKTGIGRLFIVLYCTAVAGLLLRIQVLLNKEV